MKLLLFAETKSTALDSIWRRKTKMLQVILLSRSEMNENAQFVFPSFLPSLPFDTFILFIQIAIKINHFCVFPFFYFWWTSSFFLNASRLSSLPFYCYALRLWESFTFNVYFCWKKEQGEKLFFAVDLCSLERYDFYFHGVSVWGVKGKSAECRFLLLQSSGICCWERKKRA